MKPHYHARALEEATALGLNPQTEAFVTNYLASRPR